MHKSTTIFLSLRHRTELYDEENLNFSNSFASYCVLDTCAAALFFTHYSTEDGLSQNTVMNILQDHKDNLWFATWDGINRFNGYTFKTYKARQRNYISLTNNRVDRIYEDRYGFCGY